MRFLHLAVAVGSLACSLAAGAQDLPTLKVETVAAPIVTSRTFGHGVAPGKDGGWVWVGQFMLYRGTGSLEKETVPLPTGQHYLAYKDTKARPEAEWVIADLEKGAYEVVTWPGFHSFNPLLAENGRLFFPTDYAQVYYYEPSEGTVKPMARLNESINEFRSFYAFLRGPDGMIYGTAQSTNGLTQVVRINPDTLEYKCVKEVGLPGRRAGLTYGYYLAVDPPWAYVAVGQGNWELAAVNMDTGEKKILADVQGAGTRVTVTSGQDCPSASVHEKAKRTDYWLVEGQAVPMVAGQKPPATPMSRKKYKTVEWKNTQPMDISKPPELNKDRPVEINGKGEADICWRPNGSAGDWKSAHFAIQHAEPVRVESLLALPDGSLLGNVEAYQGFFRYYPATGKIEIFPKHGPSRVRSVVCNGKAWFCGYPNSNLSAYDPAEPWTSKGASPLPKGATPVNPAFIGHFGQAVTEAHYCHDLLAPGNGRIYICGWRERWSTGTGVGYYDIATGRSFGLGQANKEIEPAGFIALPKLNRLVLSGRGKTDGKLIVYDMDLNEVERVEVKPGLADTGSLHDIGADSKFIGCWQDPQSKAWTMYLYDLAARKMEKSVPAADACQIFRRPIDNTFWILAGGTLSTLNTRTLEMEPVGHTDRGCRFPVWTGKDLFGAAGGNLVKISLPGK